MHALLTKVLNKVGGASNKALVKDSSWMLLARVLGSAIQIFYFIVVARYLGTENFGYFVGIKAIFAIVFPFVGLGMEDILIQNVSRDQSKFSFYWGIALLALVASLGVALVTVLPITIALVPSTPSLFILLILLADLLGLSLCRMCGNAFISVHQIKQASQYGLIYTILKAVAAAFLPFIPEQHRLMGWGVLYFLGSVLPGFIFLALVYKELGSPIFRSDTFNLERLKQGFFFSLSASAVTINSEVDRSMLVTLSTPVAAGIYGAGYRFIDMAGMPILAVLGASYSRFFKHGEEGIEGTLKFARKLIPAACLYGVVAGVGLLLFAPFVPKILGEEFSEASYVLLWFSPLLLLGGIQYLAADTLTGAGFQRSRSFIQVAAAVINVGLNFYLIPRYSWHGAIWATLTSETFRLIALWLTVFFIRRKETKVA